MTHDRHRHPAPPKDFASDQEVRWCPGCGDYAILKAVQKALADIGADPETTVFVSGIGCSSRFPYYMATYGFHTIHGRAPAVATGVKLANPDLDVWVVTGDGDGLSIGGNHLLHVLRRNVDLQILLFNNEIYGLTKGQYSPTSRVGTRSPSHAAGLARRARSRLTAFALGAGARFVARGIDTQQKPLVEVLKRAHAHKGASFVEIFQNCIVYNDGVFDDFTAARRGGRDADPPRARRAAAVRQGRPARPALRRRDVVAAGGDAGRWTRKAISWSTTKPTGRWPGCWRRCSRRRCRSRSACFTVRRLPRRRKPPGRTAASAPKRSPRR